MTKIKKWTILEVKDISPSPWFPLYLHKVKLPNGKVIDDYYVSKLGDVVMIFAVTIDRKVIFERQYKHGVGKITLELPAGRIEDREPEQAAKDELKEETGIIATKLVSLGKIYSLPTKDSASLYGFFLKDAEITTKQELDITENIEIVKIPINQIDEKIKTGEINTSDTLALLMLIRVVYPELFEMRTD